MSFGGRCGGAGECRCPNIVKMGMNFIDSLVELRSLYEVALVIFSVHEILEVCVERLYP